MIRTGDRGLLADIMIKVAIFSEMCGNTHALWLHYSKGILNTEVVAKLYVAVLTAGLQYLYQSNVW